MMAKKGSEKSSGAIIVSTNKQGRRGGLGVAAAHHFHRHFHGMRFVNKKQRANQNPLPVASIKMVILNNLR